MRIIISQDLPDGTDKVQDWLEFNGIDFQVVSFWNNDSRAYEIPSAVDDSIVVCNHHLFREFLSTNTSTEQLIEFLKKSNQIWFIGIDSAVSIVQTGGLTFREKIKFVDKSISPHKILYFLDGCATDRCWINQLANIKYIALDQNFFFGFPRTQVKSLEKTSCHYDYLLTMIQKKQRPHRKILWQELQSRRGLTDRGLISSCRKKDRDLWIGQQPLQHNWSDGHPSMDLYLDCCIEIVPETCYRDFYFFTEKTHKPIATKTPFLTVSTMGYLDYLHRFGFQTFDSLIDESYDCRYRVQDRIKLMVDVLEHIVHNGAYEFYQASQSILDHNFSRLCEIAGGWQYHFDQIMWQSLDDASVLLKNT